MIRFLFILALVFAACDSGNDPPSTGSYTLTVGDTLITIPTEAVDFVGGLNTPNHFAWHAYMLREYQIAINPSIPREGSPYPDELIDWKNQPWLIRATFLVAPYSRDIMTSNAAQYYYMIGTYPEQFGFGWVDTFDPEADLWDPTERPWTNPADSTLAPDNPSTLEFDGGLSDLLEYRAMWRFE
jgi:hypothetical protein